MALTGWGWAREHTHGPLGPRHSGDPGQGCSPHSSHRHYSWPGEPSRCLSRSLQTRRPVGENGKVQHHWHCHSCPHSKAIPHPKAILPGRGPAAGCAQAQAPGKAGSPPLGGRRCPHSLRPCAGTRWLREREREQAWTHYILRPFAASNSTGLPCYGKASSVAGLKQGLIHERQRLN